MQKLKIVEPLIIDTASPPNTTNSQHVNGSNYPGLPESCSKEASATIWENTTRQSCIRVATPLCPRKPAHSEATAAPSKWLVGSSSPTSWKMLTPRCQTVFTNEARLKTETADHHATEKREYTCMQQHATSYSTKVNVVTSHVVVSCLSRRRMSAGRVANTAKATRAFLSLIPWFHTLYQIWMSNVGLQFQLVVIYYQKIKSAIFSIVISRVASTHIRWRKIFPTLSQRCQGTHHHSACQSWPCGKRPSNLRIPTSVNMEGWIWGNI